MDPQHIQRTLAELWSRYLPDMCERVAVLERACAALHAGALSEADREQARSAAHKLAGALGTFGRQHGTELARLLELWLSHPEQVATHCDEMIAIVAELKEIVCAP